MSDIPSPSAHSTARRNLSQRIERFINGLGTREIDAWECVHVLKALEHLDAGNFSVGERHMLFAERAEAFRPASFIGGETNLPGQVQLRDLYKTVVEHVRATAQAQS